MKAIRLQAIVGARWSALESLSGQAISFVVFLVMARLLTPADFGVVAIANIYVLIVQFFIFQGLGQAIIQFEDLDDAHLNTVFWINLAVGGTFFAATLLSAGVIGVAFHSPSLAPILRGLSPVFILAALTDVQNNLLTRKLQFRALAFRTFFSYLLGGIVGVILAWKNFGAWSLVGQQLTVWLINLLALWTSSAWRPSLTFCPARSRRLLRFGVQILWVDILSLVNRRADQLFIGKFLGPITVGFYAVGSRVAMLVSEVLARSFSRVSFSALSRIQNDAARFRNALLEIVEMQSAIIFPAAIGLALVTPEVVQICFGPKWNSAIPIMQILLLACPLDALSGAHQAALVSQGKPSGSSQLATAHAVTNLIGFAIAIHWGALAVATAFSARAVLLFPVELFALHRALAFPIAHLFKPLSFQLLANTLMASAVLLSRANLSFSHLANLTFLTLIGVLVYATCLGVFNRRLFDKIRQILFVRNFSPQTSI